MRYWLEIVAAREALATARKCVINARNIHLELSREHFTHGLPWPDLAAFTDLLAHAVQVLPTPPPVQCDPRSCYCSAPQGERAGCA